MTEKETYIPDYEQMFSILFTKALDVKEKFRIHQSKNLVKILEKSQKDIEDGNCTSFDSDDFINEMFNRMESKSEERKLEHQSWIETLKSTDKPLFREDFIRYLWDNQREESDSSYYQYWLIMDRILCLYNRLSKKDIDFELNVISIVKHRKTPYSDEQNIPLFQFKSKGLSINFMPSDPVSDSFIVMVNNRDSIKMDYIEWESDMYSEEFFERLLSSINDKISSNYSIENNDDQYKLLTIEDDYNLFGLICQHYFKISQ